MFFKFHLDPAKNEVEWMAFLVKKEKLMFLQLLPPHTHTHTYTWKLKISSKPNHFSLALCVSNFILIQESI